MFVGTYTKQPGERFPFSVTFADQLAEMGDEADGVVATPDDPALQVLASTLDGPVAKVWVADGVHGVNYKVTVLLSTVGGGVLEAEVRVRVREV